MQRAKIQFAARSGVTLIELLVVVTILVMLMAYATSIIKPTLEDRKSRESAQLLNSYFANAQARAAALGRPVGVYLERSANDDNKVLQIYTAVTPPPFIGSLQSTRATTSFVTTSHTNPDPRAVFDRSDPLNPIFVGFDLNSDGNNTADNVEVTWILQVEAREASTATRDPFIAHPLIFRGDTVKFDYKGRHYMIWNVAPSPATPATATAAEGIDPLLSPQLVPGQFEVIELDTNTRRNAPPPTHLSDRTIPFQAYRRPQKSIAAPVELPNGMCIDLIASGFGSDGSNSDSFAFRANTPAVPTDDRTPVVIMYGPSGGLDYVYYKGTKLRPIRPIHLLVGSYEYDPLTDPAGNLKDARNRWITILPRSGEVFASEISLDPAITGVTAAEIQKSRDNTRTLRGRP